MSAGDEILIYSVVGSVTNISYVVDIIREVSSFTEVVRKTKKGSELSV